MLKIHEITKTHLVNDEVLHLAKRAQELANSIRYGDSAIKTCGTAGALKAVTSMLVRLLEAPEKTVCEVALENFVEEKTLNPWDYSDPDSFDDDELRKWIDAPTSDSDRAGIPERGEL